MKHLVIGTHNPAKVDRFEEMLLGIPLLQVLSLADIDISVPAPEEPHEDVLKNALVKARYYSGTLGINVLANDTGLIFDFVEEDQQPGAYARRSAGGDTITDREMHEYYKHLFQQQDSRKRLTGYWDHGVSIVTRAGEEYSFRIQRPCLFLREPLGQFVPGYPLSSLCIDQEFMKPWSMLTPDERKYLDSMYFDEVIQHVRRFASFE